ncbi:uncharacterized protein [Panulirus ornatus]|uniref:uncharacterized protein n=1 Tax=Panulirus ornatus TaxID=150431 RepID=UPI003A8A57FA
MSGKTDEEQPEEVQEEEGVGRTDDADIVHVENLASSLEAGSMEDSEYVLLKHTKCTAHTMNLVATTGADKALKDLPSYRKMYLTAFDKATELWNKQARSSKASDTIKADTGMLLTVPTITKWNSIYDGVSRLVNIFQDSENFMNYTRGATFLGYLCSRLVSSFLLSFFPFLFEKV